MKNKLKIGFLIIELMVLVILAFISNFDDMFEKFKLNKSSEIYNNYYLYWFSIFMIYVERIITMYKTNGSKKEILDINLLALLIIVISIIFNNVLSIFILINVFIIWRFRNKLKIVFIVSILTIIAGFSSYFYNQMSNENLYILCKEKNIANKQIDFCINTYSSLHSKDQYTSYLTYRNRELAKLNKKFKENIEKRIIDQNNDSNCTINDNYYVTNWRKDGSPCIGGGYG